MAGGFRFKRFAIEQPRSAMKVGTDGVLLGAWARLEPSHRHILDVGCGTGLIALMVLFVCLQPDYQISLCDDTDTDRVNEPDDAECRLCHTSC